MTDLPRNTIYIRIILVVLELLEGKMNNFLLHFALICSHLDKRIFSGKNMEKVCSRTTFRRYFK